MISTHDDPHARDVTKNAVQINTAPPFVVVEARQDHGHYDNMDESPILFGKREEASNDDEHASFVALIRIVTAKAHSSFGTLMRECASFFDQLDYVHCGEESSSNILTTIFFDVGVLSLCLQC